MIKGRAYRYITGSYNQDFDADWIEAVIRRERPALNVMKGATVTITERGGLTISIGVEGPFRLVSSVRSSRGLCQYVHSHRDESPWI